MVCLDHRIGLLLLVGILVSACERDDKLDADAPNPFDQSASDRDEADPLTARADDEADADAADGESAAAGDDTDSAGDDLEPFLSPTEELRDVLQLPVDECGGLLYLEAKPDETLYEKRLEGLPIQARVLLADLTASTTIDVKATPAITTLDTAVRIEGDGPLSKLAVRAAEQLAKESSGLVTIENILQDGLAALGAKHDPWKGVLCTFVPASRLVNERGGKKTVVSFDPPLPMALSPKAVAKRYEEEIGDQRIFSDLELTIEESNHPSLLQVKSLKGKVVVTRVDPKTTVDDGRGGSVAINADIAYKLSFEFGTPELTVLLGLMPEVTYYVSYERQDVVANIVDTKSLDVAAGVFLHPKSAGSAGR
jgi:hypothetical protein